MHFFKKILNLFTSKIESEDNSVKKDDLTQPRKQSPEARKKRNRRIIFLINCSINYRNNYWCDYLFLCS